jgi:nitric oxide reductase NorD protein
MPEAEDVVLEGMHRAGVVIRSLWDRSLPPEDQAAARFARERRRLDAWMYACFDAAWPLVLADDSPSRWLPRLLGRSAAWLRPRSVSATSDGCRIVLPREPRAEESGLDEDEFRLLTTLGLGARLERGSVRCCPRDPVARDVFWNVEGALAEARLVREFPGLAARLATARASALALRPAASRLRPAERMVEALARGLLRREAAAVLADVLPATPSVQDVLRFSERFALATPEHGRYRGMAPIAHRGVAPRNVWSAAASTPSTAASAPLPRGRTRSLSRHVEAAAPDPAEEEGRPGPFVFPFGDPHLSVQDPAGLVRPTDQGDEADLDALADELSRLERAPRVATEGAVREVLATDEEASAARAPTAALRDSDGAGFVYPEWDFRRGSYRIDHCRVSEHVAPLGDARLAAQVAASRPAVVRQLRRRFEAMRLRRTRRFRELDGDVVDLDAWRDDWAALRAGRSPDGRIFAQERRRQRDVAVTLLVDTSGSTDAHVWGGRRVIDVEKDALLCFCEALAALGDPHAVLSFSGQGPSAVRILRIKGFRDRLGDAVRARIAGIDSDGFTRLGAALRHATAGLLREQAHTRILLVLSDAKPYDEDAYAGDYGVEDSRQAVVEARVAGVRIFCVNVDRSGARHLARVFGPHGYASLWTVEQLPRRLPELYRHLSAGA